MKMRKFLVGLIVSITAGLSALALSACEEETPKTNNPPLSEQGGGESAGGENQSMEITITYDANGGAFDSGDSTFTQTVKANAMLTAPTSPKRTNYTFAGWAADKNGGNMWTFDSDKPAESVTLYAIWKQQSGKILSVENATMNGDEIFMLVNHSTEVVSLSSKVVCSDDSTWKLYYDRLGQTEIPTKIAAGEFGELDDGDNIFYAVVTSQDGTQVNVYELNVYRSFAVDVKFYDGTELLKTETAYTGYEYTTNYTPNITGYTFNDWNYTPRVLWDSLNLYADTTANTYTITYDVNGGNALPTTKKIVTYDSSYTLPKPTKENDVFLGWYLSGTQIGDENGQVLEEWRYTSDKTLTAKWFGDDFDCQVSSTEVTITGIKDKTVTEIVVPDFVTSISEGAFNGCSKIKSIMLPFVGGSRKTVSDTRQYLLGYIFGTSSYTGSEATEQYYYVTGTSGVQLDDYTVTYYIPTSLKAVTVIGGEILHGAFSGCSNLTSIEIPKSVTSIGACAFYGCCSLTSVDISDNVTSIGAFAFSGCSNLTSIEIPKSVTSIGIYAFYYCLSLTEIVIPNGLKEIPVGTFWGCSNLKKVVIPNSVTTIDVNVFYDCHETLTFYCEATQKPSGWHSKWNSSGSVVWGYTGEE